ncbi:MAG: Gfo/Idh/MocA family oxidoreductase [Bryobacterales bacterium]|nr:Gfo/Idh/MocA family oxidoreductase [Bryobacterales bacterium]
MPEFTRRNILGVAALVPFHAVRSSAQNSKVQVGLVGAGSRGTYTARMLHADPRAQVVAVADVVPQQVTNAKQKIGAQDAREYRAIEDLLASDIDAVMIATPCYLHPDHLETAIKAGKHIYVEKPAAVDVAGAKRVMRLADAADRKLNLSFGFQQRYGGVYVKAKDMLDAGGIGKVREVHGEFLKYALTGDEPVPPLPKNDRERLEQWKLWRSMYGEIIVETYVHNLDAINWFMGARPVSAIGTGGRTVERRGDLLDHLSVTYDYPDNVQMTFAGSQITPRYYRSNKERYIGGNGVIETAREYWSYNVGKGVITEKAERDISVDALQAFVQRVVEGKPENTGVRAAESTLTALLGQMAVYEKRQVTWDEMMASA